MWKRTSPLLRHSALAFVLALSALLLSREDAYAAGDCGGFCVSYCPDLPTASQLCNNRWGGTCGIGASCPTDGGLSTRLCGWEVLLICQGHGAVE